MSSTRNVIAPPPFAANALTTIPPTPVAGVSYRDETAGAASSPDGWPYAERVNSAEFNQILYQLSSLVAILDKKGVLGWSSDVNYSEAALAFGSDGVLYNWLSASGPALGGAKDPSGGANPTFWKATVTSIPSASESVQGIVQLATAAQIIAGTDAAKAVSPLGLLASFLGAGGTAAADYVTIPYRDKTTGVRRQLIMQWGTGAAPGVVGSVTFTLTFPNAVRSVIGISYNNNGGATDSIELVSKSTTGFTAYCPYSPGTFDWIAIGY